MLRTPTITKAEPDRDRAVIIEKDKGDQCLKIVVVGSPASGKTSICQRFASGTYPKGNDGTHHLRENIRLTRSMQIINKLLA
jgi:GTPase SAR1 family protein